MTEDMIEVHGVWKEQGLNMIKACGDSVNRTRVWSGSCIL